MQLGILLAVLATIMISEHAPAEPVGSASIRLLLTLGTNSLVVLFADLRVGSDLRVPCATTYSISRLGCGGSVVCSNRT